MIIDGSFNMKKTDFSLTEAADMLGIKRRTLAFYSDSEIVTPDIDPSSGRGTRRLYSKRNLLEFLIVRELNANGVRIEYMKRIIKDLREWPHRYRGVSESDKNHEFFIRAFFDAEVTVKGGMFFLEVYNPNSEKWQGEMIFIGCEMDGKSIEISQKDATGKYFESVVIINISNLRDRVKAALHK
jgi:DNA-binding transcriptional MerR regulator